MAQTPRITKRIIIYLLLAVTLLVGCSEPAPATPTLVAVPPASSTPIPATTVTATVLPTTQTPLPTNSPSPLPPTTTVAPTGTETSTSVSTETGTATLAATTGGTNPGTPAVTSAAGAGTPRAGASLPGMVAGSLSIYLIRQKTGGPLCDDSAVAVGTGVRPSGDIAKDVAAALSQLLAIGSPEAGDLYNPIGRSSLKVTESYFDPDGGLVTVRIRGVYKQPKDPCDNTRVRAQVWATVKQFPEITATNIYLNGVPFGDKLSNGK